MPPRRSTRSTTGAKGKRKAVDLTLSSDDDDDNRNVNSRGNQPEMDADEAFARALQAEEDAVVQVGASGSGGKGKGKASSRAATKQGGRANGTNAALQTSETPQEVQSLDKDDPQAVLREYKALFVGETRCQICHDASGEPTLNVQQPGTVSCLFGRILDALSYPAAAAQEV